MMCIGDALNAIELLKWGYSNIPTTYLDVDLCTLTFWTMIALINASYITDHPKYSSIIEGKAFLLQMLNEVEPLSQGKGMYTELYNCVSRIKEYFFSMNRAAKVIPSLLLNAAITECDINPWFVMNSSVSVERICCILTDPTHKFKVLSLEQYMDYPMTTLSSDEDENFFKTMSYFGVVMSNNHKESSHINHSQNYQNILKFDTDFNTPPFNDCEPSLPGKIYTPYMPSRIFGFPSRTNFSVHKFVNTLLPLILSISGSDNYTDE